MLEIPNLKCADIKPVLTQQQLKCRSSSSPSAARERRWRFSTLTLFDAFWRFASPPTFATHANFFSSVASKPEVDTRRWKKDQLQIKAKETKETFFGLKIILQKRICCNVFKCLETDDTVRHMPGFPIDFLANNIIICENIFLIGTFPMSRITPAPWQSGSPVHEQVELVRTKCIFSTICSSPQNTFSHFQFYQ